MTQLIFKEDDDHVALARFLAKQLSQPAGLIGQLVLPRLWNSRNVALNDFAFEYLRLKPQDRVLEVGFGGGYLLERIAATTDGCTVGVDAAPAMVEFCRKRYRRLIASGKLNLKCASAESLPFPDGYFTKTCSVNSIFYWPDALQVCAELWRVLADRGLLVLCFTDKQSLASRNFARQDGVRLYEAEEVQQMLAATGFQHIQMHEAADKHRRFLCVTGGK